MATDITLLLYSLFAETSIWKVPVEVMDRE